MRRAETCSTGAYIEVVTDMMASSPMALGLKASIQTLYAKKQAVQEG